MCVLVCVSSQNIKDIYFLVVVVVVLRCIKIASEGFRVRIELSVFVAIPLRGSRRYVRISLTIFLF